MAETREGGRTVTGKVSSNKMDKSITVVVERRVRHPVYGKYVTKSTRLHAHDESNECRPGDTVTIREVRPISKTKTWTLVSIDERAAEVWSAAGGAMPAARAGPR